MMDIEWFRDLSITVMGFAAALASLVVAIALIRLQRKADTVLQELKVASILARDTAEMVHDGVQPVAGVINAFRAFGRGHEQATTGEKKRRR